jgi:hypothetical protein
VLSTIPGEHHITYLAQGSAYWLFHDIVHVKLDVRQDEQGKFVAHRRMGKDEYEVLERADRLAKRHGISPSDIKSEVEKSKRSLKP